MNVQAATLELEPNARAKYREYRTALKTHKAEHLAALAAIYWQLAHDHKVLDVVKAITDAGTNEKGEPKLAIARADDRRIEFRRNHDSELRFIRRTPGQHPKTVIEFPVPWPSHGWQAGTAPVPLIPPACLPKGALDGYHILWEVEAWAPVPSPDPILLRRLEGALFVIVAAWNLTPAEQAVMRQGLRVR
jgi:hypothetical protein